MVDIGPLLLVKDITKVIKISVSFIFLQNGMFPLPKSTKFYSTSLKYKFTLISIKHVLTSVVF